MIVGTTLGGGMLALPLVTLEAGVLPTFLLFIIAWFLMTLAAFYLLKVSFTLPRGTNMISMAQATLGKPGQIVTWVSYLMLLYCLLAAYISGGADLLQNLLLLFDVKLAHWISVLLFAGCFGAIIFQGIKTVDLANRGLMAIKLGSFAVLIFLLSTHMTVRNLEVSHFSQLPSAILVVITSFGFAVIIPSLRDYFEEDEQAMTRAVWIGSLIPLICYVLWIVVVLGVLPQGSHLQVLSELLTQLSAVAHVTLLNDVVRLFTYICITTSFLGVSLALTDFVADGFNLARVGKSRWTIMGITYLPPLVMVLFYPAAFVHGLSLAGVFCIVLLMLLPALMMRKVSAKHHWLIWIEIAASLGLLLFAVIRYKA